MLIAFLVLSVIALVFLLYLAYRSALAQQATIVAAVDKITSLETVIDTQRQVITKLQKEINTCSKKKP